MCPPPPPPPTTTLTTTAALATTKPPVGKKMTMEPNKSISVTSSSSSLRAPSGFLSSTTRLLSQSSGDSNESSSSSTNMSLKSTSVSSSSMVAGSSSALSMMDGTTAISSQSQSVRTPPAIPQRDPHESNLFLLPNDLHRYYRPIPFVIQLVTSVVSAWISAVTTWKHLSWFTPLYWITKTTAQSQLMKESVVSWSLSTSKLFGLIIKFVTCALLLQTTIQEIWLSPSRVSMSTLLQQYFLPSPLSKYRQVTLPPWTKQNKNGKQQQQQQHITTGVHYLAYHNREAITTSDVATEMDGSSSPPAETKQQRRHHHQFDTLYLQHGFGASSLSWLPAIPALAKRMNARVAYGHDAPGFGFTDRPNHIRWYTHRASAWMAKAIMTMDQNADSNYHSSKTDTMKVEDDDNNNTKPIGLFGHSMGSLTILRLALDLPRETPKFIVLASPALGIRGIPKKIPRLLPTNKHTNRIARVSKSIRRTTFRPIHKTLTTLLLDPMGRYVLRRAVGTNGSWKTGLKFAWGDSNKLTESDVLRFSWPSIGLGWEQGILNFARAQVTHVDDHDDDDLDITEHELEDDTVLMQRVMELPNTKVVVILGSKDRIVPTPQVRKFFQNFPDVPIVELDGLGHDSFEEGTDEFVDTVETLLDKHWDLQGKAVSA